MEKGKEMYEIGYLLTPLISIEKLDDEIAALRKSIEDKSGLITNEGRAKMQKLAYTITKKGMGSLNDAYFGWIKFVVDTENVLEINDSFDKNLNIVRFLLIKTAEESASKKPAKPKTPKKKPEDIEKEEVQNEEIDKKIEELIK